MIQRFQYHAFTVGIGGHIVRPFDEIIPIQAAAALPESGGYGVARVDQFRFREILSFESASSVVAGSFSEKDKTFDTTATVTIEGLNILNVITADRIVARIVSAHPNEVGEEPSILPLGSHFENLRIAGYKVELDLALDTFSKFATAKSVRSAYREDRDGFRGEFNQLSLAGQGDAVPEHFRNYFPWYRWEPNDTIPETNNIISCSLAREVGGLGSELTQCGHAIHVPGFGTVRLAEFKITGFSRTINMLEVALGSTPGGHVSGGSSQGNGSGW